MAEFEVEKYMRSYQENDGPAPWKSISNRRILLRTSVGGEMTVLTFHPGEYILEQHAIGTSELAFTNKNSIPTDLMLDFRYTNASNVNGKVANDLV